MGRMTHDEACELLGAYAVDALETDERARVQAHVAECSSCQREADSHLDTLSHLTGGGQVPDTVWESISERLYDRPPPLQMPSQRRSHKPRYTTILSVAAAVVALMISAGLVNRVMQQDNRLDALQTELGEEGLRRLALAADNEPGAKNITLASNDGLVSIRATVLPDGSGFISADDLPPLSAEQTYQLWAVVDDQRISAGLLGSRPTVTSFRVPSGTSALAITAEQASGVVASQNDAVVSGLVIAT